VLGRWVPVTTPEIDAYHGRDVLVGVRPEELAAGAPATDGVEVKVQTTESIGYQTMVDAATPDGIRLACVTPGRAPRPGTVLDLALPADRLHFFDPTTGMALFHPPH
jgi:ABC-type sugar transport system ATPase subunit